MKTTVFSLLYASAIISADICVDICSRQLSNLPTKSKIQTFDQLKNNCSKFVESTHTYADVKTICDEIKKEFDSKPAAGGSNTLTSGGSGNTVNVAKKDAEKPGSPSGSSQVVVGSMLTTLTVLGLNFL